ncbi:hypothetical protein [Cohnella herbarum]|uniref:Tissue inhibitor of metalloproteinase n=1 Tax=Cohnella herbarum TaxID=2728023 RepID=A0A7Z2VIQ7_9BACL|nr:hypothetical protein [Cohnella herbarum]QJD83953.1 hypothetical protein HH215_12695 [Cohnella herbarum]
MLKRMFMLFLCGVFMLGVWSAVKPKSAYACSCAAPPAVSEELARKTAIFSGKVVAVKPPEQKEIMSTADPIKVTFAVDQVWKGEVGEKTVVGTASSSASCGIESFAMDAEYIVYAYGEPDQLETGICERTKLLSNANEDLTALGIGKKPSKLSNVAEGAKPIDQVEGSDQPPKEKPNGYFLIPIGGLAVILVFVVMLLKFRRKT